MGGGDHCAVWGCDNDRQYPQRQIKQPHVGMLRFFSPRNDKEVDAWAKKISRTDFKVTLATKVCSNHFAIGYRSDSCTVPTKYMKGYPSGKERKRPPPKDRSDIKPTPKKKQKIIYSPQPKQEIPESDLVPAESSSDDDDLLVPAYDIDNTIENQDNIVVENNVHDAQQDIPETQDDSCQTDDTESESELRRRLFIEKITEPNKCYKYTGVTRPKLDLLYEFLEEKGTEMRYWKGSVDTTTPSKRKRGVNRGLSIWEELILTLARTRKKFDVYFLSDMFGISPGQVSRIYNTWITFLSEELAFLVPWPDKSDIRKSLPKRYKKYPNLRIIIDCLELYIQKPKLPSTQKITWSNYKHFNTAKLLLGITPNGVISFVPPLWAGMISDKEIVRGSGLVDLLEEGDAVMADKGFLIRDLLTIKKVYLLSPAFCRGPRLSVKGTTHTRRIASLRSHVERYVLKLKQFRILSGVIPLTLKPMLDRIISVCAALANLETRPIL